jgi:hypothetical protein
MEYTEEQKAQHIKEFVTIKRRQIIATVLFAPFMLVFIAFAGSADPKTGEAFGISPVVIIPILAVALLSLVVFSIRNWRCPACDKYLGKGFNPAYCPKCGAQLKL